MNMYDEDSLNHGADPVPIFTISAVYVLQIARDTDVATPSRAPLIWARAFRIDPNNGILTTFGKLDLLSYQGLILTIKAVDDQWLPLQYDYFNLTVLLAYAYVRRVVL